MGKKKFIDKRNSATFQLMARDTSDPIYETDPSADRVFIRVDSNQYTVPTLGDDEHEQEEDTDTDTNGYDNLNGYGKAPLPDHVRREILELGFPDDGYNYLFHLREIRNTGGGSAYYENPKAQLDDLPYDVKAYDASRLNISKLDDEYNEKSIYTVASKTVNVKIQRAVDPEIVKLLDDSDLSHTGSDSEELDEDFVIKANLPESIEEDIDRKLSLVEEPEVNRIESKVVGLSVLDEKLPARDTEKSRERRHLDEQFDLLELQEYGSDSEDEFKNYSDEDKIQVPLAEKLNNACKDKPLEGFELDGKYKLLQSGTWVDGKGEGKREEPLEESAPDVILRVKAYGEKYENEDENDKEIIYKESSEDEDVWDCETIITTYSNLDNHPGKIGAPEGRWKKKVTETISLDMSTPSRVIALKGKDKLPVDFLPHARKQVTPKEKDVRVTKPEQPAPKSKEDKKERKAAVKEERREARCMKKEMKELYKCEGQRAQKFAAFTGNDFMLDQNASNIEFRCCNHARVISMQSVVQHDQRLRSLIHYFCLLGLVGFNVIFWPCWLTLNFDVLF